MKRSGVALAAALLLWRGLEAWAQPASAAPATAAAPVAPQSPGPVTQPATPAPPSAEVVVEGRSVTEAEERRDALQAKTLIGREELDQYGDTSVLDVLQRLPGITIDGETPRLRGLGAGYTLILINGEPAPPGFSLDTLAPADIERIEIIKGPSAEHGGVAGTINVILRVAPKLRQREWRGAVGYRAVGPQGSGTLAWGDRIGQGVGAIGFHLPLTVYSWVNGNSQEVLRASRSVSAAATEQRVQGDDTWRGGGFNFTPRMEWKLSDTDTLNWQNFAQANSSRNTGQRTTEVLFGPALRSVADRSTSRGQWQMQRSQLQWVRKALDGGRFELKASAQGTQSSSQGEGDSFDSLGRVTAHRDNSSSVRESSLAQGGRWRQPLSEAHVLVIGWDLDHKDRRELRRAFDNGVERITGALGVPFTAALTRSVVFVQDEWLVGERWSALLGLRGEQWRGITTGPGQVVENRHASVSPVLTLRHAFDAKARNVLRASLSRSIRVPDVGLLLPRYTLNGSYERDLPNTPIAADSAGNPLLRPESALGLDLALEQSLSGGGVLSVGLFHRRIDGLIRRRIALENVSEASVPRWVSRPANIGRARSSGLELEVKGRAEQLLPWLFQARSGLQLRAALSLYRSAVEQLDDPDARLDGQPPWSSTWGLDQQWLGGRFGMGFNMTFTPAFATQQTDRQRVWRGAAKRWDGYALWRVDKQTQLRLAANNLLAPVGLSSQSVLDLDGFAASSTTRRPSRRQVTLNLVKRF